MIKIKKIPLAVVNEDIVIGAKTMLSGAIGKIPVEGVGDVDFATLFESIFKDATYILEGKLPEKCFEKKDKILIKVSIQFENELENFYSISDLEIGTVTLVGIYRGKFNKIDIMKKLNRFMESDGLSIEESADYLGVESDDEPEGGNVMSFSDWLLIGGAALLIKNGMKKEVADREEAEEEYNRYMVDFELQQSEWERSRAVNNKRRNMPCFFNDGLSYSDFEEIAKRAGRKIKRVKDVTVRGGVIYCNAESQTGYSDWNFNVDFNDWGHVTGTYWTQTDNSDSSIPHHYGHMVSGWIHDFYRERGISLMDLSDFVDSNKDLETDKGLNYTHKEKFFSRVFGGNNSSISIGCGTENVIGEHLYPVISMLRDSGFKNIKTFAIQDINNRTSGYCYQVEQVVINGSGFFERGMFFPENTEIYVSYHDKQMIRMPFSQFELKRGNYITVGDKLKDLGFTQIYERKIEDLIIGLVTKEGSVESVLIDGDENKPIEKNVMYDYDQKFVICYHTKK